jgi:hypothetical protein
MRLILMEWPLIIHEAVVMRNGKFNNEK